MTDTTDAAAHARAIREHLTAIRQHPHGRPEPRLGHIREITRHLDALAALDAARIAAEQRAERTRQYADWLESWAGATQALTSRHMAQERERLGVDAEPAPARAEGGA